MKKTLKKALIILLAFTMILGFATTAFASDDMGGHQTEEVIQEQLETGEVSEEVVPGDTETEETTNDEITTEETTNGEKTAEETKSETDIQVADPSENTLEDKNAREATEEKYAGLSSETLTIIESLEEGPQYAEGELIVFYEDIDTAQYSASLMSVNGDDAEIINGNETVLVTFDENEVSMEDKIIELSKEEGVSYVQPNYYYYPNDDVDYGEMYDAFADDCNEDYYEIFEDEVCEMEQSTSGIMSKRMQDKVNDAYADEQVYFRQINMCEAWNVVKKYGKSKVSVAVIDTGALISHEDLGNLDAELCVDVTTRNKAPYEKQTYDDDGHGSHVSSVIGATANNGKGIAGGATLGLSNSSSWLHLFTIDAFVYDQYGTYAKSSDLYKAIIFAVDKGAKIINMSLGYQGTVSQWNQDREFRTAIDYAYNKNVVCVCAAGNSNSTSHEWPSDYEKVISVIALDTISNNIVSYTRASYKKATFSSYGTDKDIAAPGVNIIGAYPGIGTDDGDYFYNDDYAYANGTSQATPIVSSVIALMFMMNPNLTFNQVYNIITSTAEDLLCHKGYFGYDIYTAYGLINAEACVLALVPEKFNDVHQSDWFYSAVSYVNNRNIMTGMGNTNNFAPYEPLHREQLAVMLYRMKGCPKVDYQPVFKDVPKGQWYTDAIIWAYKNGIITGYQNGYFGVGDNITREQLATMLYRYADYKGYPITTKYNLTSFKDYKAVSSWATEPLKWAVGTGIVTGKDNKTRIDPQGNAARCECATMIQRMLIRFDW